jgi:hypothetical protein
MSACLCIWVCVCLCLCISFVSMRFIIFTTQFQITIVKLSNVVMLQEHKLCSRSLVSSLFFSVYYACFMTLDNTLIMIYEV